MVNVLRMPKFPVLSKLFSVVTLCLLFLSGCSVVNDLTDISTAGKAFLAELDKGNATGAAALMHSRSQQSGDMAAGLKAQFVDRKFSSQSINSTNIENGVGSLTGKCNLSDDSGTPKVGDMTVQIQKDGDAWKVLNVSCKVP